MDRRLDAVTAATGGVFTTKDAAAVGIRHEEIAHMVRRKEVVRVRRGAFVSGQVYRDADVDERYRLQVMAALRLRPTDAAAAHAALALRRLPTWGADLRRIDLAGAVKHHESGAGLRVRPRGDLEVVTIGGRASVRIADALVQHAAQSGIVAGVVAMDAAVHAKLVTVAGIAEAIERMPRSGRRRARAAAALVDPACESVGESRTRLLLLDFGLAFESQARLYERRTLIGRVDFLVEERVVVEFDGLVKYAGLDGKEVLAAEKARESRLVALGYEVVRLTWRELDDPVGVIARIRDALARALTRPAPPPRPAPEPRTASEGANSLV